jgi:hypothetical protein
MPKHYPLRLFVALLTAFPLSAIATCEVTEKQILGSWVQVTKNGFFEEMAFELDGKTQSFSSWLHQRPEIMGATWGLNNCRLSIENKDNKSLSFTFSVTVNKKGQLELKGEKDTAVSRYKRVP